MSVNLDDIDYFLAVAAHGKVRRAASELDVSQPAISQAIRRLESELGFRLFDRSSTGMQLTPVASQFRDKVKLFRGNLDQAIKEAADLYLGDLGTLRIGVSPLYAHRLFTPAAVALHHQRPSAKLHINFGLNDALKAALIAGEIDMSVSALPGVAPPGIRTIPLGEDAMLLVVREHHPLLQRRRLRLKDLVSASWLLPAPTVALRRSIEGRFAEAGLPPPVVTIEINNSTWGQLNQLILQSDLISIISESMLNTKNGMGLVPIPISDARFLRKIGVMVRSDTKLSPLAEHFLKLLQDLNSNP